MALPPSPGRRSPLRPRSRAARRLPLGQVGRAGLFPGHNGRHRIASFRGPVDRAGARAGRAARLGSAPLCTARRRQRARALDERVPLPDLRTAPTSRPRACPDHRCRTELLNERHERVDRQCSRRRLQQRDGLVEAFDLSGQVRIVDYDRLGGRSCGRMESVRVGVRSTPGRIGAPESPTNSVVRGPEECVTAASSANPSFLDDRSSRCRPMSVMPAVGR